MSGLYFCRGRPVPCTPRLQRRCVAARHYINIIVEPLLAAAHVWQSELFFANRAALVIAG